MLSGDDLLGVLTVRSRSESLAGDEDLALITTLAAQAAVAVQNAGAYADAVARGARLSTLVAVTRSITASLDTTDVIRRIVDAASAMRPGALAAVHAIDAERGATQVTASPEMSTLPLERPLDAGLPGLVSEQLTGVRFVAFWLADDRTRTLVLTGNSVPEIVHDFPRKIAGYDEGTVGWIARHREPLVIDDVISDDRVLSADWWRRWGLRSFA